LARGPSRVLALLIVALAAAPAAQADGVSTLSPRELALVNRVTWGVNETEARKIARMGPDRWLELQLKPTKEALPPEAQAQIDGFMVLNEPMMRIVMDAQSKQDAANRATDPEQKKAGRQAYEDDLNTALRQAQARSILRDLYSPNQLQEQMTWFWFNHFSVQASKANIRAMVGDYEDRALRPHALGRFRTLLEATLRHPAMLRYLDNADNAQGHINENYAREIMELHTLGVGSGYTQKDVEELARILTGVGIDAHEGNPKLPPNLEGQLVRDGLFEFNPKRHDYGDKDFLGHHIKGRGFAEVEEALDILSRDPATARHISRELAVYFVADNPPESLVKRMSATFIRTDGDIAQVLRAMFHSPEFTASLGAKFKDPAHYVLSSVRLAYDDRVVLNTGPIQGWLRSMGEGLYARETPDGFPMTADYWNGPGQLETRFEIAQKIGGGGAGLFRPDGPGATDRPGFPVFQNALYYGGLAQTLSPGAKAALTKAVSPQDWNALFLSSPDFMHR
jgi:uncharacterized protein (DUF1800 family)